MNTQRTEAQIRADLALLQETLDKICIIHNSLAFEAKLSIVGIKHDGCPFLSFLVIDKDTPEVNEFFNAYGATLSAKKLLLEHELLMLKQQAA